VGQYREMRAERGYLVAGRYELADLIALGGMGEVWRARDLVLNRPVAVKLLRSEHAGDAAFLARFRDEARHAASLAHPNIATVHDYGEQDGWAYLVMELVEGESLAARLARTGPTGAAPVIGVLGQVGDALAVAHRAGIVHRDVKPANILLTPDGRVKLTDFGIAKAMGASSHTASGVVVGTARYLSPEQATGSTTSPASDVYALGLVAYEMLTGRPPFTGTSDVAIALAHVRDLPPSLPADVPPALSTLIGESLAKDPARRPADAATFAARLRAVDLSAAGAGNTRPVAPPVAPPGSVLGSAGAVAEPEPTRIDASSRGGRSGTAVAPAGFAAASANVGAASPIGGRTGSVLGDLPAHHRSRRRWAVVMFAAVALLAIAAGGFLVARALDDDDPAGASNGSSGDSPVTTLAPAAAPTTAPPPTTAAPAPTTTPSTTPTTTTAAPTTTTTTTAPSTTVPATPPPSTLPFDPARDELEAFKGEDADLVLATLAALGIEPEVEQREVGRKDRGKVVDIKPDGSIPEDGLVTVYVGVDGNGEGGEGNGDGGDD
jgi:tRNA A-37 threonylcarbamoyl transferase component Bud32